MFKKIIFKTEKNLTRQEFEINFKSGTNIIIGPKGGGKSTLFNLIVGMQNGYISKPVLDALASKANISPVRAVLDTGEVINLSTLSKITKKEYESKANKLDNVIWQNDIVKSKLDDTKKIIKEKESFLDEILVDNKSINNLIKSIKDFYNLIKKIKNLKERMINWENIFLIKDKAFLDNPVLQLDYNNFIEISNFNDIKKNNLELDFNLKKINSDIKKLDLKNFRNSFVNNEDELQKNKDKWINSNEKIQEELILRNLEIDNNIKTFKAFDKALINIKDSIKKEEKEEAVQKYFISSSKNHFNEIATTTKEIISNFNELTRKEIKIEMGKSKKIDILKLKADDSVIIGEDLVFNLLKTVLYTPNSNSDVEKWINKQLSSTSMKEFSENLIINRFKKELIHNVHIMANEERYEALSNGQKSIFGIKYKLANAINSSRTLFMDQPEDNLDNLTIKDELVDKIKSFKGQTFIVTHNANIGILSNVNNVIVANFGSENPYVIGKLELKTKDDTSDAANYLEGGVETLNKRYEIIFKEVKNED